MRKTWVLLLALVLTTSCATIVESPFVASDTSPVPVMDLEQIREGEMESIQIGAWSNFDTDFFYGSHYHPDNLDSQDSMFSVGGSIQYQFRYPFLQR